MSLEILNLVLSAGGVGGVAHAGALEELARKGLLNNLKRVAGVSAGAIVGLGAVLKFTPEKYRKFFDKIDLTELAYSPNGLPGETNRLAVHNGRYKQTKIYKLIAQTIREETGIENSDPTFRDLRLHGLPDFYTAATDMSRNGILKMFSFETEADMSVAAAICASAAAPMELEGMSLQEKSPGRFVRSYRGQKFVDGALVDVFPLEIFDRKKYLKNPLDSEQAEFNPHTFGLFITNRDEMNWILNNVKPPLTRYATPVSYFYKTVAVAIFNQTHEALRRNENNKQRTFFLDNLNVDPFDDKLKLDKKLSIYQSGKYCIGENLERIENNLNVNTVPFRPAIRARV